MVSAPQGRRHLPAQLPRGRAEELDAAPARFHEAAAGQEARQALHHRRHRAGREGRHGQPHQHHHAGRVLQAGRRHPLRGGRRVHEGAMPRRPTARRATRSSRRTGTPSTSPSPACTKSTCPPSGPTPRPSAERRQGRRAPPSTSTASSCPSWRRKATSCPSARIDRRRHACPPAPPSTRSAASPSRCPQWNPDNVHPVQPAALWSARTPPSVRTCVDEEGTKNAPETFETKTAHRQGVRRAMQYRMQVSPLDCTGCGNCAEVCPAKEQGAWTMKPLDTPDRRRRRTGSSPRQLPEVKDDASTTRHVKDSQFSKPLFEFSGACAGCGETPYVKLVTQLFGDRMMIANATGCSSIYGGSAPDLPLHHRTRRAMARLGRTALFEDNAEFGFGMNLAVTQRREKLADTRRRAARRGLRLRPNRRTPARSGWMTMNDGEGRRRGRPLLPTQADWPPCDEGCRLRSLHAGTRGRLPERRSC